MIKQIVTDLRELAKIIPIDDKTTNPILYKIADNLDALQEVFESLIDKNIEYFSYSPRIGFQRHTSFHAAIDDANNEIYVYRRYADANGWNKNVNQVCWGVVTQKATQINDDYEFEGINTGSIIKQIQIDAEDALVEKIGDMFDVATSNNEKDAIGQTYCLLKYGILPFLRDTTVMSERNKMVVAKLAYAAEIAHTTERTCIQTFIREMLQTIGINKKCLAGAYEYDVAKIRKYCPEYWNAPMGLKSNYKGLHIKTIGEEIFIKDSQGHFYIEVPHYVDITSAEQLLNEWISQINKQ